MSQWTITTDARSSETEHRGKQIYASARTYVDTSESNPNGTFSQLLFWVSFLHLDPNPTIRILRDVGLHSNLFNSLPS